MNRRLLPTPLLIPQWGSFEAQKSVQAAETRAAEAHNWKKREFEWKENRLNRDVQPEKTQKEVPAPATAAESVSQNLEMAA